jgi:hypothetical protein
LWFERALKVERDQAPGRSSYFCYRKRHFVPLARPSVATIDRHSSVARRPRPVHRTENGLEDLATPVDAYCDDRGEGGLGGEN